MFSCLLVIIPIHTQSVHLTLPHLTTIYVTDWAMPAIPVIDDATRPTRSFPAMAIVLWAAFTVEPASPEVMALFTLPKDNVTTY